MSAYSTTYTCDECGETYDRAREAEQCCPDEEEDMAPQLGSVPVDAQLLNRLYEALRNKKPTTVTEPLLREIFQQSIGRILT